MEKSVTMYHLLQMLYQTITAFCPISWHIYHTPYWYFSVAPSVWYCLDSTCIADSIYTYKQCYIITFLFSQPHSYKGLDWFFRCPSQLLRVLKCIWTNQYSSSNLCIRHRSRSASFVSHTHFNIRNNDPWNLNNILTKYTTVKYTKHFKA